jgi:CheY-like chemotaxis protein
MISTGLKEAIRGDTVTIKLLAVDDSNTMRKVLGITFAGDGFDAAICKSGAEALQFAQARAPDVALIDAYLAGENGYELCAKLRSIYPSLEVLILSSKQRPYDEGAGRTAGASGNFDKPFDSQKLLDKIQSLSSGSPDARPAPQASAPASVVASPAPLPLGSAPLPTAEKPSVSVPRPAATFSGAPAPRPQVPVTSASRAAVAPAPVPAAPLPANPSASKAAPLAAATASAASTLGSKLNGLGLSADQVQAVLALSREVVEQVVWEVVPALAETMIKEEIRRLTTDAR